MAKFSLVFAAAGVLLIVAMATAEASTRTVFTTTTFEENPLRQSGIGSDCSKQIMGQQMLNQCGMYIMKVIEGKTQGSTGKQEEEDYKQMCCMQLQNVGQECMCPALKMMANQPMWSMMGDAMMSVAKNLPTECNLMSQPCQMRAVWL